MSDSLLKNRSKQESIATWKSVQQLAELWGMDQGRAGLVVMALLANGRLEESRQGQAPLYRLVG